MEKYKNIKEFETNLQNNLEIIPDYVEIDNIIFTMDCYDLNGQEVTYGNKRTLKGISVLTSNRYKNGIKDAEVSEMEESSIRNDIVYLD